MKPDKDTLERWMRGELSGEELSAVETWANAHSEELEGILQGETTDSWATTSTMLKNSIKADEEPPYGEFLNHKIQQQIEAEAAGLSSEEGGAASGSLLGRLKMLWAPMAAAAMAVCFYAGTQVNDSPDSLQLAEVQQANVMGEIYVPHGGVTASVYENDQSGVIILEGLSAIPDALDIVSAMPSGRGYPEDSGARMVKHVLPNSF